MSVSQELLREIEYRSGNTSNNQSRAIYSALKSDVMANQDKYDSYTGNVKELTDKLYKNMDDITVNCINSEWPWSTPCGDSQRNFDIPKPNTDEYVKLVDLPRQKMLGGVQYKDPFVFGSGLPESNTFDFLKRWFSVILVVIIILLILVLYSGNQSSWVYWSLIIVSWALLGNESYEAWYLKK